MKTLKTLLAVTLLFSTVAPSFAASSEEESSTEEVVVEQTPKANVFAPVVNFAKGIPAIAKGSNCRVDGVWNRTEVVKTAAFWTLVAAAVTGAGYAAYNFLFADEAEEVEAPATEEPAVNTVPAPVAPVVAPAPVVKQPRSTVKPGMPRKGRFGKGAKQARTSKARARKASCKSCK